MNYYLNVALHNAFRLIKRDNPCCVQATQIESSLTSKYVATWSKKASVYCNGDNVAWGAQMDKTLASQSHSITSLSFYKRAPTIVNRDAFFTSAPSRTVQTTS